MDSSFLLLTPNLARRQMSNPSQISFARAILSSLFLPIIEDVEYTPTIDPHPLLPQPTNHATVTWVLCSSLLSTEYGAAAPCPATSKILVGGKKVFGAYQTMYRSFMILGAFPAHQLVLAAPFQTPSNPFSGFLCVYYDQRCISKARNTGIPRRPSFLLTWYGASKCSLQQQQQQAGLILSDFSHRVLRVVSRSYFAGVRGGGMKDG